MDNLLTTHKGACHCGAVSFEVQAPADLVVQSCNCSMCVKTAYLHLIVIKSRFRLITGKDQLKVYTFNTGVAQHYFCNVCGVKSFYIPRSHPDGISANVRCLEPQTIRHLEIEAFDGQNWEANIDKLAKINKPG